MKKQSTLTLMAIATIGCVLAAGILPAQASIESKTWPASEKAETFVKDTIVIGFFASPWGAGWTEDSHLHDYLSRSREAGITGHSMTLAAAGHTWDHYLRENHKWRDVMSQKAEKFTFVRSIRDIESAHIRGTTAVIWNSQTSTILDGDLSKVATLREMGIGSMILTYNDIWRAGCGQLAAYNGTDFGLTDWGRAVIDEMVKYGIIVDLSHTGSQTANDAIDHMEKNHPGVPIVYTHSVPAGLYKDEKNATKRGCYRSIPDDEAIRAAKLGGFVSPTFTEWMLDGIWPDDITPQQCAQMIDYYVKLIGVDHVGIASDDMFTTAPTMDFVKLNPGMYADGGYMTDAFAKGATGCGELAKILPAITDELWKMGYSDEDIAKVYGGNKMRVYRQVWERVAPEVHASELDERNKLVQKLKESFQR